LHQPKFSVDPDLLVSERQGEEAVGVIDRCSAALEAVTSNQWVRLFAWVMTSGIRHDFTAALAENMNFNLLVVRMAMREFVEA
jgi:hypothetical protein